jgi:hypothetical protein
MPSTACLFPLDTMAGWTWHLSANSATFNSPFVASNATLDLKEALWVLRLAIN